VSATSAGGVVGNFASEDYQAGWYRQMLGLLACDPNVAFVNIFHLIDESALEGWQSGLYYADQTPKRSAQTVEDWLAQTGGACMGTLHPWTPSGAFAPPKAVKPKPKAHAKAGKTRRKAGNPSPHRIEKARTPGPSPLRR
jgi:hypothetical protein